MGLQIRHMFSSGYRGEVLGKHQSFCSQWIQQTWPALFMLEWVLADNRDITRIVEIGTGCGALSIFFGIHMSMRNGKVLTLDIVKRMDSQWHQLAKKLDITFEKRDAFKPVTVQRVKKFIKDGRALIFCDGGDKKIELPLYAKILKKNDLIMAHDWGPVDMRHKSLRWGLKKGEIRKEHLDKKTLSILKVYRQKEFDALFTRILSMRRI